MVTSRQPIHEPSTYICVLKGIQEYILHMLYCRLISNSTAIALEEIAMGACGCILPPRKAAWFNARNFTKFCRVIPNVNLSLRLSDALLLVRKRSGND